MQDGDEVIKPLRQRKMEKKWKTNENMVIRFVFFPLVFFWSHNMHVRHRAYSFTHHISMHRNWNKLQIFYAYLMRCDLCTMIHQTQSHNIQTWNLSYSVLHFFYLQFFNKPELGFIKREKCNIFEENHFQIIFLLYFVLIQFIKLLFRMHLHWVW